jgi:hypothetical protein
MSIPCDVVVLPDSKLEQEAITASHRLSELGGLFTLEVGKYYPHASLYMLQLRETDIDTVKDVLSKIAAGVGQLSLNASRFYQSQGYVDVEYERTEQLDMLQQQVVTALNPIRDGIREKDKVRMLEAEGLALENFKNYGYKYVGELFRPHISFTRFEGEQPDIDSKLPSDLTDFNGVFTRLGLFEMGDNGTCVREIGSWDIS